MSLQPDIRALIDRYPPECQPLDIEPLGAAGGMSGAQFWRIAAPRGMLALRCWPVEHPTQERLTFNHAVLAHAAEHGCSVVPVPLFTIAGDSFVAHAGHLWELVPWMPGTADYHRAPSPKKLRTAMTALGQFHVAVSSFPPSLVGHTHAVARHLARLRQLTSAAVDELSCSISPTIWPELAPLARTFITALPAALRAISQLEPLAGARLPIQPCIRDIWHDHVLFTGDEVTGIIDFGAVDIDTPATDIARLLGSFSPPRSSGEGLGEGHSANWREGLAAYSAVRPLSDEETAAVHALNASGTILAGCNWIRWIYSDGRTFDDSEQVLGRLRQIVARLNHPGGGEII